MDEYVVETRAQLAQAVLAAAQPTFEEARKNPAQIICGTTKYTFKEGIHESRAKKIAANIRRTSAAAWSVK